MPGRIGVCSWSLLPHSVGELVERMEKVGLSTVQLALDPLRYGEWPLSETREALIAAGIEVSSGMMGMAGEDYSSLESIRRTGGVRPDERWESNRVAAVENARLARELGLGLVTFHAGFIPHDPSDGVRHTMVGRLQEITDIFAERGVRVGFETGQETAATLLSVLEEIDRPSVGVNFDPANMILYGMGDPVESLRALAPRVVQLHIKDALPTETPGEWGREVPVGKGAVDWDAFFAALSEAGLEVDCIIERESGADRLRDIRTAHEHLKGSLR